MFEYIKISGIFGNFLFVGFDMFVNMMMFWVEEYKCFYLNVNI